MSIHSWLPRPILDALLIETSLPVTQNHPTTLTSRMFRSSPCLNQSSNFPKQDSQHGHMTSTAQRREQEVADAAVCHNTVNVIKAVLAAHEKTLADLSLPISAPQVPPALRSINESGHTPVKTVPRAKQQSTVVPKPPRSLPHLLSELLLPAADITSMTGTQSSQCGELTSLKKQPSPRALLTAKQQSLAEKKQSMTTQSPTDESTSLKKLPSPRASLTAEQQSFAAKKQSMTTQSSTCDESTSQKKQPSLRASLTAEQQSFAAVKQSIMASISYKNQPSTSTPTFQQQSADEPAQNLPELRQSRHEYVAPQGDFLANSMQACANKLFQLKVELIPRMWTTRHKDDRFVVVVNELMVLQLEQAFQENPDQVLVITKDNKLEWSNQKLSFGATPADAKMVLWPKVITDFRKALQDAIRFNSLPRKKQFKHYPKHVIKNLFVKNGPYFTSGIVVEAPKKDKDPWEYKICPMSHIVDGLLKEIKYRGLERYDLIGVKADDATIVKAKDATKVKFGQVSLADG